MIKYGALVAFALCPAIAFAQPGGSDMQTQDMQPPQDMRPPPGPEVQSQPQQQQVAPTRATFVSTGEEKWDVYVDKQAACATPCTLSLLPLQFIALRTQERNPIRLDVGYMPPGDLMVTAEPLSRGLYAGGIVMTSFAGIGLATGITLTAVGYGSGHSGLGAAGLITAVPSAVGLYAGIYMMRRALPKASIGRAQPYTTGTQVGIAGSF